MKAIDKAPEVPRLAPRYRVRAVVKEWIATGRLFDGEPLPSERELAERIGVGRSAIRSAMELLQRDGLIVHAKSGERLVCARPLNPSEHGESRSNVLASTVVVLTPYPEPNLRHRQPGWVEQTSQGVIHGARSAGYDVLAMHPDRLSSGGLDRLLESPPVGVLLPEVMGVIDGYQPSLKALRDAGIAVVVYGGDSSLAGFDRILSDHHRGSVEATRWLIERGRRRVRLVWYRARQQPYWYEARRAGYEQAMRDAGLEPLPTLFVPPLQVDVDMNGEQFDHECREQVGFFIDTCRGKFGADALFCYSDCEVPYAAGALRLCGVTPGEEVLLAGYDHYLLEMPERAWGDTPAAITVDKRNWSMGEAMVQLMEEQVGGRLPQEPQTRIIPPSLVELGSSTSSQATS